MFANEHTHRHTDDNTPLPSRGRSNYDRHSYSGPGSTYHVGGGRRGAFHDAARRRRRSRRCSSINIITITTCCLSSSSSSSRLYPAAAMLSGLSVVGRRRRRTVVDRDKGRRQTHRRAYNHAPPTRANVSSTVHTAQSLSKLYGNNKALVKNNQGAELNGTELEFRTRVQRP